MPIASDTLRADHNPKFYQRFLWMGILILAGACWFLRDGMFAWPAQREQYLEYKELVDDFRGDEWADFAASKGWSTEPPPEDWNREVVEINGQYWWAAGCAIAGVFLLLKVWLPRGRWIESTGSAINTSWGQTVPYDAVTEINKRRWQNKGIAVIKYRDGDSARRFVLDDFKFVREPTDAILAELEQVAGEDKIVGGPPESATVSAAGETEPPAEGDTPEPGPQGA